MRWKPAEELVLTEVPGSGEPAADGVDDTAVLLHLGTRLYYTLNGSGLFVFRRLQQGEDEDAIATALTQEYAVSRERAQASVRRLAQELADGRLIVPADA